MDFVLGAAFVAWLILCALSVAFILAGILGRHRSHAGRQFTPTEQKALTLFPNAGGIACGPTDVDAQVAPDLA